MDVIGRGFGRGPAGREPTVPQRAQRLSKAFLCRVEPLVREDPAVQDAPELSRSAGCPGVAVSSPSDASSSRNATVSPAFASE
jgi:hypothetical protein